MITHSIQDIIDVLKKGDIAGIPTETVYGLGANGLDEKAVQKIFTVKGRPNKNPLILHTHSLKELKKLVKHISPIAKNLANYYWPGPLTILFDKSELVSDQITAGSKKVAIRIPKHPMFLEILKSVDFPIAAPSANPYQSISPTTAQQVDDYFKEKVPFVLDGGKCDCGLESTIVGIEKDTIIIYRMGGITIESLRKFHPKVEIYNNENTKVVTSGMDLKHYAPKTKLIVVDNIDQYKKLHPHTNIGVLAFKETDNKSIAKEFYHRLYQLDQQNFDLIITTKFKNIGIGKALNDKLQRASYTEGES
ncbi:MAG: L-threonylcarbamoyladenylate synthase, partial [Sediminibacterium sp.]